MHPQTECELGNLLPGAFAHLASSTIRARDGGNKAAIPQRALLPKARAFPRVRAISCRNTLARRCSSGTALGHRHRRCDVLRLRMAIAAPWLSSQTTRIVPTEHTPTDRLMIDAE